jgi:hypothetical protein
MRGGVGLRAASIAFSSSPSFTDPSTAIATLPPAVSLGKASARRPDAETLKATVRPNSPEIVRAPVVPPRIESFRRFAIFGRSHSADA